MEINEIFASIKSELLTEEVKTKIITLIEASVKEKSEAKVKELEEKFETYKEAELSKLEEKAVSYVDEYLIEKISDYFSHVAESYIEENKLEIEKGLKADLYEKLAESVRNVLIKNGIPEGKAEVSEDMSTELTATKADLNKALKESMDLKKKIKGMRAIALFNQLTEGLSTTQKSRVQNLSEDFDIDNVEIFTNKIKTLVETIKGEKAPVTEKKNPANEEASLNETAPVAAPAPTVFKAPEGSIPVNKIDDLKYIL